MASAVALPDAARRDRRRLRATSPRTARRGPRARLSVADNLALSRARPAVARGIVDAARVEQSALGARPRARIKAPGLDAEVATLSGGNQQKIVIGKWLERAPRVLLLDEPTRGVDVGAKAEIYALIEELVAHGHAVVIASSDLPEVVRLADRVIVLREGSRAGELAGDDITQLAIMQLAVGTRARRTCRGARAAREARTHASARRARRSI